MSNSLKNKVTKRKMIEIKDEAKNLVHQDAETSDHEQTVVVIDDEYTSRTILGESIQSISPQITVKLFANPIEGLEWLEHHSADLVFTDYNMKQMSGHMVLKKIRSMHRLRKTPVVVVSSINEKSIRYQLLEDGALDFIGKPVDLYEFVIRCKNILQFVTPVMTTTQSSRVKFST